MKAEFDLHQVADLGCNSDLVGLFIDNHIWLIFVFSLNLGFAERAVEHKSTKVSLQLLVNRIWDVGRLEGDGKMLEAMALIFSQDFNCHADSQRQLGQLLKPWVEVQRQRIMRMYYHFFH